MDKTAKGIGLKGASSYQRYEDDTLLKKPDIPLHIARGLAKLFVGRGAPPITEAEVLSLAGLENLSTRQVRALDEQRVVWCVGEVAAGVWRDAFEWVRDDWIPFPLILLDSRYPNAERRALRVRGDSMDELYPDGSYIVYVRLADIGRKPQTGDRVIVLRHRHGQTEATVKEYRRDGAKRRWLVPRSSNPSHTALEIDGKRDEEIEIMGLVVGSQRVE
jgi:SOS-response transcriptional repressor LexA